MLDNKGRTMMNLTEPKKKKRVRLQPQPSLPIATNEDGDWRIYTAHLSASGTCVVDPAEMEAVYSMGFFGKGSLSRSFPSFGRCSYGAPPIARNRQWVRRQKWLEELQSLNENNGLEAPEDVEEMDVALEEHSPGDLDGQDSCNNGPQASTSKEPSKPKESELNQKKNSSEKESELNHKENSSEKESELNPKENDSVKESEEKLEEPSNKKLKVDKSGTVDEAPEVTETGDAAQIATQEKSQNDISVIPDESSKDADSQKATSSGTCNESVKVGENDKYASSVIGDDSAKVDEVVLDSTEDEEICEIVENDAENDAYLSTRDVKYRDTDETMMEEESNPYEVLVLPDTDSDTENYLSNVKSRIEKEGFPINETLHLTFEETFFLMYGLGCLQLIHYDGSVFSINNAWNHFQLQDNNFIQKYVVYHYFRSKGWVVKPGLKFGGDFLLYKQGPPFYHASYIVIIEVVDADTLLRDDVKSMRKVTWKNLIGLERLSETIAKEILFAQILWPSSVPRNGTQMSVDSLSDFTVRELLWRRWNPKRKQNLVSTDDEESDST